MSEAMLTLTREQVQSIAKFKKDFSARPFEITEAYKIAKQFFDGDGWGGLKDEVLPALCTMALSSIAMREALKPFAERADEYENTPDHHRGTCLVSDLRRAAEAYQEQGK